ncbi:hypothetical protein RFI_19069 [Reticulomyxa filosa]|uniref:Uncharacterized protein n=1 Tax=Reticulomyxa filosa TaxID=46433 RepID=X6MYR4_RETFI|nr:hypothetical protein RFI_19069 [Reticulomyxa filosa]|eukprot:ETO18210.1 hypothetical protein RFI_19069 [Reticulomyxa filosa]
MPMEIYSKSYPHKVFIYFLFFKKIDNKKKKLSMYVHVHVCVCVRKGYKLMMLPMPTNDPNHKTIPQSAIVYKQWTGDTQVPNAENLTSYHHIAHVLHHRYIEEEAELQINISFRTRKKLTAFFKKCAGKKKDDPFSYRELFEVFDTSMQEVISLLKDSETRFMEATSIQKMKKKGGEMGDLPFFFFFFKVRGKIGKKNIFNQSQQQ